MQGRQQQGLHARRGMVEDWVNDTRWHALINSFPVDRHHHYSIVTHTATHTYEQHIHGITCAPKGGGTLVSSKARDQETDTQDQVHRSYPLPVQVHAIPDLVTAERECQYCEEREHPVRMRFKACQYYSITRSRRCIRARCTLSPPPSPPVA